MTHTPRSSILLASLLGCCGCQRADDAVQPGPASVRSAPATLAGEIMLAGDLGKKGRGTLTLEAWADGVESREGLLPLLTRTYVIGDPDWTEREGTLTRYFGLCDSDRVGDAARLMPEEFEIEASFDPDGLQATREGIVRAAAHARNGAKDVQITVTPQTETAQQPGRRKKDG
jgi:hypothetical protein